MKCLKREKRTDNAADQDSIFINFDIFTNLQKMIKNF